MYSEMSTAHASRYSLISNWVSVLHMYEGYMQSALIEIFAKGMKRTMTED